MSNHKRVIPRDFFNEAKLLKCLGRFELLVKFGSEGEFIHNVETSHDGEAFKIVQNPDDGCLYVENYSITLNGKEAYLFIPYNPKESYPLILRYLDEDYYVFNENGRVMPTFLQRRYQF